MKLGGHDLPSETCRAVGDILGQVGNKWSILVMVLLNQRPRCFNDLRRDVTVITQKVLTSTLRGLERDGFVKRVVLPDSLGHVEYSLTALGGDVLIPMNALATFALTRREDIEAARHQYDHATCIARGIRR